eukprot:795090-Rhodomonas_salina.1
MGRVERRRWMGLHGLAATGPNRTWMAGDADPHCVSCIRTGMTNTELMHGTNSERTPRERCPFVRSRVGGMRDGLRSR